MGCVTATHILIACLASEVAGAFALAWSLARITPESIAANVPLRGSPVALFDPELVIQPTPMPDLARAMASQRAEARLGIVLLAGGLSVQAFLFFLPVNLSPLETWTQRAIGAAVAAVVVLVAASAYRWYVPRAGERVFEEARQRAGLPPST